MTNLEWIAQGNTGCTFATLFARKPEQVGWKICTHEEYEDSRKRSKAVNDALILQIDFPVDWTAKMVRSWVGKYEWFHEHYPTQDSIGLRYIGSEKGNSWVQYFGQDSHVETRRSPAPMLMYTRKLNPLGYYKQVGFTGVLHLAHAFAKHLTDKMVDTLWKRSYEQVKKKLGKSPGSHEAAKVTWLKKDVL